MEGDEAVYFTEHSSGTVTVFAEQNHIGVIKQQAFYPSNYTWIPLPTLRSIVAYMEERGECA